jgi:hypothetical protein
VKAGASVSGRGVATRRSEAGLINWRNRDQARGVRRANTRFRYCSPLSRFLAHLFCSNGQAKPNGRFIFIHEIAVPLSASWGAARSQARNSIRAVGGGRPEGRISFSPAYLSATECVGIWRDRQNNSCGTRLLHQSAARGACAICLHAACIPIFAGVAAEVWWRPAAGVAGTRIDTSCARVLLVYVIYRTALLLAERRVAIASAILVAVFPTQVYACNEFHSINF